MNPLLVSKSARSCGKEAAYREYFPREKMTDVRQMNKDQVLRIFNLRISVVDVQKPVKLSRRRRRLS